MIHVATVPEIEAALDSIQIELAQIEADTYALRKRRLALEKEAGYLDSELASAEAP